MKKKKIIIIIVCVVLVICGIIALLLFNSINKEEKTKDNIILKDNLEVEINSEVNLLSFISEDNKVKIVSEDETIDTSKLGEQELTIKYLDNEKEEEYTFKIKIIDTQAPTIEYEKELSTTEGTKIDLLKDVKVNDNSKEEIKATVEGEYDINKVGTYNLKYIAIDSSNNKTEEDFTLKVNEKPKETTKSNTNTSKNTSKNNNTSNNTSNNSNSNNGGSKVNCDLYPSSKVFTSIPNNSPYLSWNSARFYVTEEVLENGNISYRLHNERISGVNIGQVAANSIREIIGDYSDMRYTKENPIILYQLGACYSN